MGSDEDEEMFDFDYMSDEDQDVEGAEISNLYYESKGLFVLFCFVLFCFVLFSFLFFSFLFFSFLFFSFIGLCFVLYSVLM